MRYYIVYVVTTVAGVTICSVPLLAALAWLSY